MQDSQKDISSSQLLDVLDRIANALEVQSGTGTAKTPENWANSNIWLWQAAHQQLKPVSDNQALPLDLLVGIDNQAETLLENTQQFASGFPANNALLWGARGTGKSALTKSIHQHVANKSKTPLHLVEIYREDIGTLPTLLDLLRDNKDQRFILFCDDLSFDEYDSSYKSLKAVLDGGIEGRPDNVILYATSNRRHLLPRNMIENERSTAIHKSEAVEEKVSLSDRFGLWLGFYNINQDDYLTILRGYAKYYGFELNEADALEWAMTRGNRSGRVAWQYVTHIAGIQKVKL